MIVRSLLTLLLAIPLTIAIAACGDDDDGGTSGDGAAGATSPAAEATTPSADDTATPEATTPSDGESEVIDISAQDFAFAPASISAVAGEEVTVTITNTGNAPHTFTIDDLDVDVQLSAGEEATVSFTPSGDDTFYCRFHRSAGMEGTLSTDSSSSDAGGSGDTTTSAANEFSY
jgi:plastocyanin